MAKGSTKAVMGKASALKAAAASKQAASNASKAKAAAASNATAKAAKPPLRPGAGNLLGIPGRAAGVKRVPSPGAGGRLAGAMQGLGNAVKRTAINSVQRAAGPKSGGPPAQRAGASPMQGLGAAAAGAPRPGMKKGGTAKKRYT